MYRRIMSHKIQLLNDSLCITDGQNAPSKVADEQNLINNTHHSNFIVDQTPIHKPN